MCFFFNSPAPTEIYTLSLHDALPIFGVVARRVAAHRLRRRSRSREGRRRTDRKSTRLNSSHQIISYAVFCLKKKKYQAERADPLAFVRLQERQLIEPIMDRRRFGQDP